MMKRESAAMVISTTQSPHPLANVTGPVLLVGAGKMGSALLEGWMALGLEPSHIAVIEPQPAPEIAALAARGLRLNPLADTPVAAAAIVIAVKPQNAPEVLPILAPFVGPATVVLSIMAGRTLQFLGQAFPAAALVRAMPNTPAAIGRGITVAVGNARVAPDQRTLVHGLLSAVGAVEWVDDEAADGRGDRPLRLRAGLCLSARRGDAKAGIAAGLPPTLAAKLARAHRRGIGRVAASLAARGRHA